MTSNYLLLISLYLCCGLRYGNGETWETLHVQPEQVHLSLGANETQMIVTWVTFDITKSSTVWYGINDLDNEVHGTNHKFVDGGSLKRAMFIHRANMRDLIPGQIYRYHVGSEDGWSAIYQFRTLKTGSNWSPKFAVYGDLGNINGVTLARLQDEVQRGFYDAILHDGDMAYDMHTNNATVGDEFMRQIEPMAAYLPYQVSPGNHEHAYNFSNYNNRFSMVSRNTEHISNHFWSYDIGPSHIIAFSTEFYYFPQYGTNQIANQYRWLEADLIEANKPENRAQRPWIITMGHRPIYAQNHVDDTLRLGYVFPNKTAHEYGFEELFYKYGVDLEFWAHEHNYERIWPIYNNKVFNGSFEEPYTNPKAPVHIITGSAGNRERHTSIVASPYYSAFRIEDYGYTRMTIHNSTHLYLEQVSEDKHGEIIDKFYLIKEKHGPEAWL